VKNNLSKITYKTVRVPLKWQNDVSFSDEARLGRGVVYKGVTYKPAGRTGFSASYYSPKLVSKSLGFTVRGLGPESWTKDPASSECAHPLSVDVVVPGGGATNTIKTEVSAGSQGLADSRRIGRLLALDYILETLLFLSDKAPVSLRKLTEELIPQDKIVKIMSDLSRNDLVEIHDNFVSLTPKARKITALLREKLTNTPS
jgi:hypothetical protein